MAVVGTLSALVLGLLISNANTSFATKKEQVTQISADIIRLDRLLRRYGQEAQDFRRLLRQYTEAKLQDMFPRGSAQPANLANDVTVSSLEELETKVLALTPTSDAQRWLQAQALQLTSAVEDARWQLVQESASNTRPEILVLIVFWFSILFASFGLFAPRNMTALVTILLCSIGVGSAIAMMIELQTPFQGLIRISSAPMAHALEAISR